MSDVPGYQKSFRKNGKTFKVGEEVLISYGTYQRIKCTLREILGTQIWVTGDEWKHGQFFFYNGLKIEKVK